MKKVFFSLVLLLLVLFQIALSPVMKIKGLEINFLLLASVVSISFFDPKDFLLFAFISGLFYDLLGFIALGTTSLSLIFATTVAFFIRGRFLRHKNMGMIFGLFGGIVIYSLVLQILGKIL